MDLKATVVAMRGDQVVRVQCRTCRGERAFRAPKGVIDPGKAPPPKAVTKGTSKRATRTETGEKVDHSVGAEWRKEMNHRKERPLNTYSPKMMIGIGDRIAHPTFGEGVVLKPIHPNKAEIIFEMDIKVLIVGGARTA
ncbi:MAG: hypothetical protein H7301_02595 [Cryobacterium sp.]|nr:hypothetical protein [Oligoflexia bacterium]